MMPEMQNSPEILVEMLLHLGRLAHGEGMAAATSATASATETPTAALSTAQWSALRYLSNANRFSRTPSAFAKFHGTTRGTASQTIRGLVKQGYLTQSRAVGDGRGRQLDLTEKAKAMRLCDPFEAMVRAAGDLPTEVRRQFGESLTQMLHRVARDKGARPFGSCTSCAHLERGGMSAETEKTYACGITQYVLENENLGQLCVNFQQADPSTAAGSAGQ